MCIVNIKKTYGTKWRKVIHLHIQSFRSTKELVQRQSGYSEVWIVQTQMRLKRDLNCIG